MKLSSNFISYTFLFFSSLLLLFTFYKDQFVNDGEIFNYYVPYYSIFGICTLISIISFKISKNIKVNTILVLSSIIITLYLIEITILGLNFYEKYTRHQNILKTNPDHDFRDKREVYNELLKTNKNAVVSLTPANFVGKKNLELYPLSGFSKKQTLFCNENGYYVIYDSDRYGFKNPDYVWDNKNDVQILFVGDSFTHGACVNMEDDIPGNFRKLLKSDNKNNATINFGFRGQGPLIELAILKEYLDLIKTNIVVQIYYENDLGNLELELQNDILINYLDNNYRQNIIEKDELKNQILKDELTDHLNRNVQHTKNTKRRLIKSFLKLKTIRSMLFIDKPVVSDKYKKILLATKEYVENSGSEYVFVYLPSHRRYRESFIDRNFWTFFKGPMENTNSNTYKEVIKLVKDNNINLIDLHEEFFKDFKNSSSVAPYGKNGHFNEYGYKIVSEKIFQKIKDLKILK